MIIGYTQGTYDMFHIGHLNLIKNAKKHCDYLIVGVNSDALVEMYKNKKTIIPIEERVAIIEELKSVDKVIICDTLNKTSIAKEMNINKIFIGDDWKGNPRWEKTKQEMAEIGVEVVFLPHTDGTSSTMLREKLSDY